jgi:hypothetical protein
MSTARAQERLAALIDSENESQTLVFGVHAPVRARTIASIGL